MAVATRGRAFWIPPVLLFVATILLGSLAFAIATFDRGGETLPAIPDLDGARDTRSAPFGPTGTQLALIWQATTFSIFGLAGLAVLLYLARGGKVRRLVSVWDLTGYAFGLGVAVVLLASWPYIVGTIQSWATPTGTASPEPGEAGGLAPFPTDSTLPIAAVAFVVTLLTVYMFAFSSRLLPALADRLGAKEPERQRRRLEAASAVRRTLLDLEAGEDFRTAVLACYQRMCGLFAARGVVRQDALTAREIEGLALSGLGLSQSSVDDLTGLFEEARYSVHDIGPAQRDRAVECLTAIRRELEG